jgi:hypothetical protein
LAELFGGEGTEEGVLFEVFADKVDLLLVEEVGDDLDILADGVE